jgi:hypothetical protein
MLDHSARNAAAHPMATSARTNLRKCIPLATPKGRGL